MRTCSTALRRLTLVSALLFSCWTSYSEATERNRSYLAALESINPQQLQQHVAFLADDRLEGREPGTIGGQQAGDYLQSALEALQICPAGVDGSYGQLFSSGYRNILGLIEGSDPALRHETVLVCAHYDHVGYGTQQTSRAETGQIHNGADDNASGTAALLELAEAMTCLPQAPKRSVLIAFWDAEEMGVLGSRHWVAHPTLPLADVVTVINLDMVGRLRKNRLTVFGSRSGVGFRQLISQQNDSIGLDIDFSWDLVDNSDHFSFFQREIPVLFMHTGLHDDYHTPRDDAHLINSQGMNRVVRLLFHLVNSLGERSERMCFRKAARRDTESVRRQVAGFVPTLPDRFGVRIAGQFSRQTGVRIRDVAMNSPAARAGLRVGDRILKFDGISVADADELNAAVYFAPPGAPVAVCRAGSSQPLDLMVQLEGQPMRLGISWREDDAEPHTVILIHVVPGSPAARAGLRAGDRIYRVGAQEFDDGDAFVELVTRPTDILPLLVERDGQQHSVVITFGHGIRKQSV